MKNNDIYKIDVPTIGYLRAAIIILVNFCTLTFLPNFVNDRLAYVLISALIMSLSFVLSAYKFGDGKKKFDKWFFIKFISVFLLISFMLFVVMYQK